MPNECWQADFTQYDSPSPARTAAAVTVRNTEILTWLDDHSRPDLLAKAKATTTGPMCWPPSDKPPASTDTRLHVDRHSIQVARHPSWFRRPAVMIGVVRHLPVIGT